MSKANVVVVLCCLLAITGVACLIAGLVMLGKSTTCEKESKQSTSSSHCEYSSEAKRIGLPTFLKKVYEAYKELHPLNATHFMYDPSPAKLKQTTDRSLELLRELQSKSIVRHKLKPRERKAVAQATHFLAHSFGTPFAGNYYGGDYLLGPDMFCWQPICRVNAIATKDLMYSEPTTIEDIEVLLSKIRSVNHTFAQYKANLIYGVQAGMVRSNEPCQVGVASLVKDLSREVVEDGAQGILKSDYAAVFSDSNLSNLTAETKKQWLEKTGKQVNDSLADHVVEYIGKPMKDLITYLQTTYIQHCLPSNVSSGLATLPITHVYVNGTKTSQKTNPFLPDGTRLNGSKAYEYMLSYFSTTKITPSEVQTLGYEMIAKLYSEILGLARQYTNQTNNDTAKEMFKTKLNSSEFYYDIKIPEIESNGTAHARCTDEESAQKYCPVRWKIIQMIFDDLNKIMSMLDGATIKMFHFTGQKQTTPNCPISLRPNFNPNMGVPSYTPSTKSCPRNARYNVPFFLSRPGPKFNQFSVNSHEARPGHHTQVQGHNEHFRDSCRGRDDMISWLGFKTKFVAFVEGWALYAETPLIGQDTKIYDNRPTDKYGMFRSQLWRALRLVVDTGLHYSGFSRQKAMDYFINYAWVNDDVLKKEITRYQSNPGQATSYMIGGQHILKLRARAEKELGKDFNLKDFHYYLLRDGSAPLSYITESIEDYIRCTKNNKDEGCEDILSTQTSSDSSSRYNDMDIDLESLPKHLTECYY